MKEDKKYIVKVSIKELFLNKGDILVVGADRIPYSVKNNGRKYPFIDIKNTIFFEPFTEKYKPGTCVKFDGVIYEIGTFDNASKTYSLFYLNSDKPCKFGVTENKLTVVEMYYFLSSRGIVQQAFIGKDKTADDWRRLTNNFHPSKESAQKAKEEILIKIQDDNR